MSYTIRGDIKCVGCGLVETHEISGAGAGGTEAAKRRVNELIVDMERRGWNRSDKGNWFCPTCSDPA